MNSKSLVRKDRKSNHIFREPAFLQVVYLFNFALYGFTNVHLLNRGSAETKGVGKRRGFLWRANIYG